ncbi:DUF4158 domain-containing protein [Rhizobium mongolense]|uniref:DUF4158 domain-containing protein n=1 Tax=Rhizobium mongolense TaxID=57676 RepID=UPI003558CD38
MRKHELLSEAEREQLLGFPADRDDLARLYTFEPGDLDLIRRRRGPQSPRRCPSACAVSPP